MNDALNAMAKKYPIIGEVRGRGAMQAIELVKPGTDEPNSEAQLAIIKFCISQGVLIISAGTYANVIRLLPPLTINEDLLREGLSVLEEAIASIK
jgi:4-aminobutyrate aminotransferase/(S)-3-amino-2-methylpropionate transaminase